jgi:malectin (di-glucose binding ER protein)
VWRLAPQLRLVAPVASAGSLELPPVPGPVGQEIRLLAGSSAARYVDHFGNTWSGDRFFKGGAVFSAPSAYHIIGTQDPVLFQSRREGIFSYDIPLKPGVYELHLYFAETLFGDGNIAGGGETYRLFDILANGKPLVSGLDVVTDAPGPNTADIKVYKDISPAADGFLHLTFPRAVKENSFLNAIEILPGIPGRLRPVRIVARDTSVNTKDGTTWGADSYFIRGQRVTRAEPIKGAADAELYLGERYGNFAYSIPVAPGRYTVTLMFCETWFGPKKPAGGGAGYRVFDVLMNGTALLRNFEIFKEAGGEDRPLRKVFHSLQPNAQGKLVFSFVPVKNYACINAIEVLDEGR